MYDSKTAECHTTIKKKKSQTWNSEQDNRQKISSQTENHTPYSKTKKCSLRLESKSFRKIDAYIILFVFFSELV